MEIKQWSGKFEGPGFYADVPEDVYHGDPVPGGSFSSTQAKTILKSAAHLRHYLDAPRVTKKAFDFGHLVHAGVLGVGAEAVAIPESALSVSSSTNTKDAKAFIALARENGQIPVKQAELVAVEGCVQAVLEHPLAGPIFDNGTPEVSAFAQDPVAGLWLRARFDWVAPDGVLVDLKTTRDGEPMAFERSARMFGYDLQDAFYQHVYKLITGKWPAGFRFVTVESEAPHLVDVHDGDLLWEARGQQLLRRALERYSRALKSGEWPGREPVVNYLSVPNYLIEEED